MASNEKTNLPGCFQNWMVQLEEDLKHLTDGMHKDLNNDKLKSLVEINIKHLEEYHQIRRAHASSMVSSFFSPSWCSAFENSYIWAAGCRPTLFLKLVYTLCGASTDSQLHDIPESSEKSSFSESLSAEQLVLVNDLHTRTIQEEYDLSLMLARMQEKMADKILIHVASDSEAFGLSDIIESDGMTVLEKADTLRLKTLKEMVNILTPLQAVEFLIASKKLHISIHRWCNTKEHDQQ